MADVTVDQLLVQVGDLKAELDRLRHNYRSLLEIHAMVKMDTDADRKLHTEVLETFAHALDVGRVDHE